MADLKGVRAQYVFVENPPTAAEHVVRKGDLETILQDYPTAVEVEQAIEEIAHAPAQGADTNSIATTVDPETQVVSSDLKLTAETEVQAAATGQELNVSPTEVAQVINLGKIYVTNVVVILRTLLGAELHAGVEDVDYFLDAKNGTVKILSEDLVTGGVDEEVHITFDCAQVMTGPGAEITGQGVTIKWGSAHNQVPYGDHEHANDHRAANGGQTNSITTTVDDDTQKVTSDLRLAADPGLEILESGVRVDATIARASEVQDLRQRLSSLEDTVDEMADSQLPVTVDDTNTAAMTRDENGKITTDVRYGTGLTEELGVGLAVDFDVVAQKTQVDGHETRISDLEDRVDEVEAALELKANQADLEALAAIVDEKADQEYVDTQLALKSDKGHMHFMYEIWGLPEALDEKADIDHTHDIVTSYEAGFMSPEMHDNLACLSTLIRDAEAAQRIMSGLRLESPSLGGTDCPLVVETKTVQVLERNGDQFKLRCRFGGVFETKEYTGGSNVLDDNGDIVYNIGGTPAATPHNGISLVVSSPAATYNLNPAQVGADVLLKVWDYTIDIIVDAGADVQLVANSQDSAQLVNSLVGPEGIRPYPEIFNGQFMECIPVKIMEVDGEPYCDIAVRFGEPNDSTGQGGGGIDNSDGQGGLDDNGGGGGTDGRDGANGETISFTKEIDRLSFIENPPYDLSVDGYVHAIRCVAADEIWIGGAFTRVSNVSGRGLARLERELVYPYNFGLGSGFTDAITFISAVPAGGVIASAGLDCMFRDAEVGRPMWKVTDAGRNDDTFVAPFVLSTGTFADRVLDIAVLENGMVAVITAQNLTVLNAGTGAIVAQYESDLQLNAVFADGNDIILSSHAFSAANTPHEFEGVRNPKGLKKLAFNGSNAWALDEDWADWDNAGSGANSSCGRVVKSGGYYYVGNARAYFNSPDTSWNAEQKGNLLLWSQVFSNAVWQAVGSPVVITDDTNVAPDGTTTADTIADNDGATQTYIYQDITIPANTERYSFSLYIRKDSNTARFPLLQMQMTGGTAIDVFAHINTQTGAVSLTGNLGGGSGAVTTEDVGSYWRITISATNNNKTTLRAIIHPAYSSTMGGAASAITGSIIAWGAQVRLDDWQTDYVTTTTTAMVPTYSSTNANRFRGLYVIDEDGQAHPTWACNITLSEEGHVIPVGVDQLGRVYIIGPIASIDGTTVVPWRLYRLTAAGAYDRQYSLFNNRVLAADLTVDCKRILCGGKFTLYGSNRAGYLIMLNPDGTPVTEKDDAPIIVSDTEPDVEENPCLMKKPWYDISDPCGKIVKTYNECSEEWEGGGNIGSLPAPTFVPASGAVDPATVAISVPGFPSAAIYYTVDGSTPTTSSFVYSGPIDMSDFISDDTIEVTIKAFAVLENYSNSPVATAEYTLTAKLPDPVFTPGDGAVTPVMVSIAVPGHGDATIYYTTDGSEPDLDSAVYTTAISVSTTTTIKAFAVKDDYRDSDVVEATYAPASYGSGQLPTPVFTPTSGTQPFDVAVTITVPGHTTGLTIYYTTDGEDPTYSSPRYEGDPIVLTTEGTTATIKAFATKATYSPSEIGSKVYTMETLAAPTINPSGTEIVSGGECSITHAVSGVSIYYTTNGDTPTTASTLYAGPFAISSFPTTVKAIAVKTGYQTSAVASKTFTQLAVATPVIAPTAGTVAMPINVSITCATSGALIYYTTNGTTPTTGSTLYTGAFEVSDDTTVKAIAVKTGYANSAVAESFYTDNLISPSISPANGSTIPDQTAITLTQTGNPVGTQIYYTLDGSTPDNTDTLYTGAFLINANMTVKAVCVKSGYDDSAPASASYTKATVPTPTASPAAGGVPFPTNVTLACSLSGAIIHYTTDGDDPTTSDPVYSAPIAVSAATTIKALARKAGYNNSAILSAAYTQQQISVPTFSPAGGAQAYPVSKIRINHGPWSNGFSVIYADRIRVTTNGTDPDGSSEMGGRLTPFYTTNPADVASHGSGVTVDFSKSSNLNHDAARLSWMMDGDANSALSGGTTASGAHWVRFQIDLTEGAKANAMMVKAAFDNAQVRVYGSNDEVSWSLLSDTTPGNGNLSGSSHGGALWEILWTNTTAYRYYAVQFDWTQGNGFGWAVNEIQLFRDYAVTSGDLTLKAIAEEYRYAASNVAQADYTQAQVATPVASPAAGAGAFPRNISLSTTTVGDAIRYTTNGDTPTSGSTLYSGPITIGAETTIKAKGFLSGYIDSAEYSGLFTQQQIVVTMTPTPPASASQVTLAANVSGSTIYYTTDGSEPDTSSFVYAGTPIAVSGTTTIKAFAKRTGYLDSSVVTGVFN